MPSKYRCRMILHKEVAVIPCTPPVGFSGMLPSTTGDGEECLVLTAGEDGFFRFPVADCGGTLYRKVPPYGMNMAGDVLGWCPKRQSLVVVPRDGKKRVAINLPASPRRAALGDSGHVAYVTN